MVASRRSVVFGLAGLVYTIPTLTWAAGAPRVVRIKTTEVENLFRVTPRLYRSAQPTRTGFHYLSQRLGIKTILSLREHHDDADLSSGTELSLQRVPMNTWHIGDDEGEKVVRALRLIREGEKRGPVLVHCQHGSDRTGAIIALYRIVYQGWNKERAIREMMQGGFGFHPIWASLPEWGNIPAFIRKVDIDDLKRRVGV